MFIAARHVEGRESGSPMKTGWLELLHGDNAPRCAVVGGGMIMHAINVFIVTTILPTVVRDIGGLQYFAWNTTLYVLASLFGAASCARILQRIGARRCYRLALTLFALGCGLCAAAPAMPVLLVGRFIQGLGAGTLSALSFVMVRSLFPERLWPRAMAVISAAWGIATLTGPAVGGIFAEYHAWRVGFATLLAITPLFAVLVERSLPRGLDRPPAGRASMAYANLALLSASVLCVSVGSMSSDARVNAFGLGLAFAGFVVFVHRETTGGLRLLPCGACDPANPLGASYCAMALLLLGVNTEIFVPYFLQTLHGMRPIYAGYLSALMAAGWTVGSIATSGSTLRGIRLSLSAGPGFLAAGLVGMWLLMPQDGASMSRIAMIGVCLFGMGTGIGLCWPHLGTRAFAYAPNGEKDLAASSITMVVMLFGAFGSAVGGMVTNLGGLNVPGGVAGAAHAAAWLFGGYAVAPLLAMLAIRQLLAMPVRAAAE
jgi:MFS family permease